MIYDEIYGELRLHMAMLDRIAATQKENYELRDPDRMRARNFN